MEKRGFFLQNKARKRKEAAANLWERANRRTNSMK